MQTIDLSSAFAIHHITSWPKNYILPNVVHTWAIAFPITYSDSRQVFFNSSGGMDIVGKRLLSP